jgi:LAO/AO transport system ATPase
MSVASLLQQLTQRNRRALARLLTLVARGEELQEVRAFLKERDGDQGAGAPRAPGRVVALTGSAGVGKSSLIGKLIESFRNQGQTVAVLACDPESPLTGGALLGDRFRMPSRPEDEGVFIRSLATAPGREAIAEHLDLMVELLQAYGFDWILLETVGAGQGDTAVRRLADVVVLLLQPEAGDDIQWEKAGLLEVADLVVIHKADLPGAERVEAQVRGLLNLPGCRDVPVLRASASKNEGLPELVRLMVQLPSRRLLLRNGRSLLQLAQERLAERFERRLPGLQPILERWQRGECADQQAAEEVLKELTR